MMPVASGHTLGQAVELSQKALLCDPGLRSLLRDPCLHRVNYVRLFGIGPLWGACFPWNSCVIMNVSVIEWMWWEVQASARATGCPHAVLGLPM